MAYDSEELIAYRMQRARETIEEVNMAIEHERFLLAENRIYYGMFYMVMALALKHGFMTSKHAQLLGWFNKEFVRTGQVDVALGKVYQAGVEEHVRLLKIKAILNDGSLLYITELHTPDYQKYSYHWQKANGELFIRWDNKPHWKQLATFPDHKHEGGEVHPSHRVSIDDVILEIKNADKSS